jgi:hypothetical protein
MREKTREEKSQEPGQCLACVHFRNDPASVEKAFSGLTSLSSAYGSTSADDGLCLLHGRYLTARSWCGQFAKAGGAAAARVQDD